MASSPSGGSAVCRPAPFLFAQRPDKEAQKRLNAPTGKEEPAMSGNHHLQAFKELTRAAHDASARNEIVRAEALYEALHLIESCMSYNDYQAATAWHRNVFLPPASQLPPLVH